MLTTTQPDTALRFARETMEAHLRQACRDRAARIAVADRRRARAKRGVDAGVQDRAQPGAGGMFALMRKTLSGS